MRSKKSTPDSASGGRRRGAAGRSRATANHSHAADVTDDSDNTIDAKNKRSPQGPLGAPLWTGGNRILATLSPDELSSISPSLVSLDLSRGHVLYEQRAEIESVYFPDTAVASLLSRMENGAVVEVGTIGNEGMVGLGVFLGSSVSIPQVIAQVPGRARCMPAAAFRSAIERLPGLREVVGKCTHAFMTQVSQTAACNRLHGIEQRCARWLLLTHDRVGGADTFSLTHQFLSFMLGVRRAGVTEALGSLTRAGLIKSKNGEIAVLDRHGLEEACCECYSIVRLHAGEPFNGEA